MKIRLQPGRHNDWQRLSQPGAVLDATLPPAVAPEVLNHVTQWETNIIRGYDSPELFREDRSIRMRESERERV